ncbi:phage conserved hypothetical protein BR0599 [Devosia crocina]|uniref:Bacteriophage phiJL001 Gp84 C-terminal domain-containing protein n=1 Tax=Devosia crocina TaxID=429728 RepID=A0A1I7NMG1_9HYPH|nr:DUF2163 domain-containing protein [Devosia crocina]SFV35851.1 phage conserved hypothetical protein BR0599 [Devosia crocina]
MRSLEPGFAAHLQQSETTLSHCWRVLRTDGVVLGFTDHDRALAVEGTICSPMHGLDGGEVPLKLGAQVDTGEVLGILRAEAISESDILLGRYDGAVVETWRVNWTAPEQRLRLRVDTVGEIVREYGIFRAELRSAQESLNTTRGRLYQGLCDALVGDRRCGVVLDDPAFSSEATVAAIEDPFRLLVSGLGDYSEDWFAFGMVRWSTGQREGLADAVMTHRKSAEGDLLGFGQRVGDWLAPGDGFSITAGCDRRFVTCRQKFANAVNFRGFPHVPGSDFILRHPREGDALDGRAVVR